jgi:tRNA threonylcarbamoyladenosine biosynthesis protein TsaB
MLLLGIETATRRVGVVLASDDGMLARVELGGYADHGPPRHAEQLAPAIDYLRAELDVELGHLAAIAVGIGPGLFTGLRIGVTTAKVMAQTLRIPVVGVPSLDLVAYPLRHTERLVVAVLDARRHEVFSARYQPVPGGVQRVSDYAVYAPAELVAELAAETSPRRPGMLLAGDGVARFPAEFGALDHAELAGSEYASPSVAALVELATARAEREEFDAAWTLNPMYLRNSDAEINWDRKEVG